MFRGSREWHGDETIETRIVWCLSAKRGSSNTTRCPRRAMGANRCPTPRTRGRMRWERRLYGMKQQAGASCLSRTPSISLAPPHLLWSTFFALFHLFSPAPFYFFLSPLLQLVPPYTDHADTSQQPATSCYSKVISPNRSAPLPSFPSIHQGSKELKAGKDVSRSRITWPFLPRIQLDFVVVVVVVLRSIESSVVSQICESPVSYECHVKWNWSMPGG